MGQTLEHGIYLPDEGERNCYSGLAANWRILDTSVGTIAAHTAALAGKAPLVHTHTVSQITDFPAYGNAAGTICEGNDSRLSDARTPVAHTHTKSDVTDLLNSNFIPSANNSYDLGSSSYQWNNIYSKGYYYNGVAWGLDKSNTWSANQNLKNTAITDHKAVPFADTAIGWGFWSNDSKYWGGIKHNYFTTGVSEVQIAMSNWKTSGSQGFWHLDFGATKDFSNVYFQPSSNNIVNLGSSSNQWKSVYAQSYYYNGVAWGLDKANVWSAENTFTSNNINIKRPFTLGDNTYQVARLQILDSASTPQRLGTFNFVHNANNTSRLEIGIYGLNSNNEIKNRFLLFQIEPDETSYFAPLNNSQINLGTSTNKWKSFNGINPGALSLPVFGTTYRQTLDTTDWVLDGSAANTFTPSISGWLNIRISDLSGNYVVIQSGAITVSNHGAGVIPSSVLTRALCILFPVEAGTSVSIRLNTTSVAGFIYPCEGNV